MRKNVTAVLSVLSLSLLLTACQEKVEQKQVVGVVDTARIYTESKAGLDGGKYLEDLQMSMQNELIAMQESLQENPSEASIMLFQQKYASFQERIALEQEQVVTTLNDALQTAMDAYRAQSGLEVLVAAETVMSMSADADVTGHIITALDKMKVEFTPVIMPEPVMPEAVTPEAVTPEVVTPEKVTPEEVISEEAAPQATNEVQIAEDGLTPPATEPSPEAAPEPATAPSPEAAQE
ncbi:MAG: OmpH family outer membrane protein [Pseudomonadota bacterium]